MTIVCIIPFCIHIENKHQCGEKSMKFLKILAGSEDGGDLVLVVHYTSSDPAMLRHYGWTGPSEWS